MFIPDPDLDLLPIPDPEVKKGPGSGSATLLYWSKPFASCKKKKHSVTYSKFVVMRSMDPVAEELYGSGRNTSYSTSSLCRNSVFNIMPFYYGEQKTTVGYTYK
jgi:hypothetical protein